MVTGFAAFWFFQPTDMIWPYGFLDVVPRFQVDFAELLLTSSLYLCPHLIDSKLLLGSRGRAMCNEWPISGLTGEVDKKNASWRLDF